MQQYCWTKLVFSRRKKVFSQWNDAKDELISYKTWSNEWMNAAFVLLSHSYPYDFHHYLIICVTFVWYYYTYSVMSHHFESLALCCLSKICRGSDVSLNADLCCHSTVSGIQRNTVIHTPFIGQSLVLFMKDASSNHWAVQENDEYLIM